MFERIRELAGTGTAQTPGEAGSADEANWERPGPSGNELRRDALGVVVFLFIGALAMELSRGFGALTEDGHPIWLQHLVLALMISPLVLRRKYPVAVMLLMSAAFIGLGLWIPVISLQMSFQVAYFASLYSAVAWARNRRVLWLGTTVVVLAMTLWLILGLTVANTYDEMIARATEELDGAATLLEPLTSVAIYYFIINFAYFGGAILAGLTSWRKALQRTQLAEQGEQIRHQAAELARRAVVDERLRIARELHDVVAHHIAVVGVHAGAARRVLTKKPEAAIEPLRVIESTSRQAVTDMRNLLGVLRTETAVIAVDQQDGAAVRGPEPGLDDIEALAEENRALGLRVILNRVEDQPGDLETIPAPLALSIYRTAQESLTNVRRHSTSGTAKMTLRTGRSGGQRWVELETLDDGRPRPGAAPASSGYGLQGIRERVALHRGMAEIGPRAETGWRVRARFNLN